MMANTAQESNKKINPPKNVESSRSIYWFRGNLDMYNGDIASSGCGALSWLQNRYAHRAVPGFCCFVVVWIAFEYNIQNKLPWSLSMVRLVLLFGTNLTLGAFVRNSHEASYSECRESCHGHLFKGTDPKIKFTWKQLSSIHNKASACRMSVALIFVIFWGRRAISLLPTQEVIMRRKDATY